MAREKPWVLGLLEELGYEAYWWEEPGSEPSRAGKKFSELLPSLSLLPLGQEKLYDHQYRAIEALEKGMNIVLTARTGSGKTEAWVLPVLRNKWKALAIYPTLALSADQIRRLEEYSKLAGLGGVVRIDRPTLSGRSSKRTAALLANARIVVTNPAFLLAELKRMAGMRSGVLRYFLGDLDLIVVDELDFYDPRAAHLLLKMIEIIVEYLSARRPRIAVLSATLGNPRELAEMLTSINGRETVVIEGKPFRVKNYTVVVLGKNANRLRDYILAHASEIAGTEARWVLDLVEDEEEFREHLYEVYNALEAIGLRPPRLEFSVEEILAEIARREREGRVTLVFTKSIKNAERVYRELRELLGSEAEHLVAVHHHLVSKEDRERVEEAIRLGRLRVVVTVRTLAQGIDIGSIARIVHVGLPVELREYMQREGRKGRRKELGYTETVIIPSGVWDRKLLERGAKAVQEWLNLPYEKLFINPGHDYALAFSGLWKLERGLEISSEEARVLERLGLAEKGVDALGLGRVVYTKTSKAKRFWRDLNFYEHGPPYGYKKIRVDTIPPAILEDSVSFRDAVEKYQPGCFDPTTELIVVGIDPAKKRILLSSIEAALERYEWLQEAVARYEDTKRAWGEYPDIVGDMKYGRIYTSVVLNVYAPREGFGELVEYPVEVAWIVESRKPRLQSRGGKVYVYREVEVIGLASSVEGRHRDYTYGYVFEAPGTMPTRDIGVGLAALLAFLRTDPEYALPLGSLSYRVYSAGGIKVVHLWEREAAGIIERLDWLRIAEKLEKAKPGPLLPILMSAVDVLSAYTVMSGEVSPEEAYRLASRIARIVSGYRLLAGDGLQVVVPRHSPDHGIAALAILHEEVGVDAAIAVAWYTGESPRVELVKGPRPKAGRDAAILLLTVLDELAAGDYTVYYYGEEQRSLLYRLSAASYILRSILGELEKKGRLVDAAKTLEEAYGPLPLLAKLRPRIQDYREWLERVKSKKDLGELEKALKALAKETVLAVYDAVLAHRYKGIRILSRKAS